MFIALLQPIWNLWHSFSSEQAKGPLFLYPNETIINSTCGGGSFAALGDQVFIGCEQSSTVHLYQYYNETKSWNLTNILESAYEGYGTQMYVTDDLLVVTSYEEIHVHERTSFLSSLNKNVSEWTAADDCVFTIPLVQTESLFGSYLGVEDPYILVGVPNDQDHAGIVQRLKYKRGCQFELLNPLESPRKMPGGYFGSQIRIDSGSGVFVSAIGETGGGMIYWYPFEDEVVTPQELGLVNLGFKDVNHAANPIFGSGLDVDEPNIILGGFYANMSYDLSGFAVSCRIKQKQQQHQGRRRLFERKKKNKPKSHRRHSQNKYRRHSPNKKSPSTFDPENLECQQIESPIEGMVGFAARAKLMTSYKDPDTCKDMKLSLFTSAYDASFVVFDESDRFKPELYALPEMGGDIDVIGITDTHLFLYDDWFGTVGALKLRIPCTEPPNPDPDPPKSKATLVDVIIVLAIVAAIVLYLRSRSRKRRRGFHMLGNQHSIVPTKT